MDATMRKAARLSWICCAIVAQACIAAGGGGSGGGGGNGLPGGVTPTDATSDSGTPFDTLGGGDAGASGSDTTPADGQSGGDATGTGGDTGSSKDGTVIVDTASGEVAADSVIKDTVQDGGSDSGKTDSGGGEIGPPKDTKDGDAVFVDSGDGSGGDVDTDAFGNQSCCWTSTMPGCADVNVAMCVCAKDSYCCTNQWDGQCAKEVNQFGCGFCAGGPDGGGSDGGPVEVFDGGKTDASDAVLSDANDAGSPDAVLPGTNSCCETSSKPGCIDPAVMQCVCAIDAYCCKTAWDSLCVGEVTSEGCGVCAGGGDGGGSGPDAGF